MPRAAGVRLFPCNLPIPDRPCIPDTRGNRFVERPCRRRVTERWIGTSLLGCFATKRIERVPAGNMTRGRSGRRRKSNRKTGAREGKYSMRADLRNRKRATCNSIARIALEMSDCSFCFFPAASSFRFVAWSRSTNPLGRHFSDEQRQLTRQRRKRAARGRMRFEVKVNDAPIVTFFSANRHLHFRPITCPDLNVFTI